MNPTVEPADPRAQLYARHGFTQCGPFGDYSADGPSLFMEKRLG